MGGNGVLLVSLVCVLLLRSNASKPVIAENSGPRPVNKLAQNKVANPEKKAMPLAKPRVADVGVAPKVADPVPR